MSYTLEGSQEGNWKAVSCCLLGNPSKTRNITIPKKDFSGDAKRKYDRAEWFFV